MKRVRRETKGDREEVREMGMKEGRWGGRRRGCGR